MMDTATLRAQHRAAQALASGQWFKLIGGGSFTEAPKLMALAQIYASAGAHVIDIAPDADVLSAVKSGLSRVSADQHPLVMVSLPLDPDPHFRKIALSQADCIACNLCVPVCPTEALKPAIPSLFGDPLVPLNIEQPLCYGCGRCPQVCPTEALTLLPHHPPMAIVEALLTDPAVGAVEIHTHHADPDMLLSFLAQYGHWFQGKLLSVCFRPNEVDTAQWIAFIQALQGFVRQSGTQAFPWPLILQIDGASMTGTDHDTTFKPALANAHLAHQALKRFGIEDYWLTISGGINNATALALQQPENAFIVGAGLGTFARRWVWSALSSEEGLVSLDTIAKAKQLVALFTQKSWPSAIMLPREQGDAYNVTGVL